MYDNLLSAAILFAGLGSLVWLLTARGKDADTPVLGLGNTRPLPDRPAAVSLPISACVRGFFRPTMVIYFVVSLVGILAVLGIGLLLGIFGIWGALG